VHEKIEQIICIKSCCKIRKLAVDTLELLKEAFGKSVIYKWHAKFKGVWEYVRDVPCAGRPST
jgi:hypothetical protein